MTIFNADWRREFQAYVLHRLAVAHPDLTRMAAALRNGAGVEVWTESPSDATKVGDGMQHYSLEGWRAHYRDEFARLNRWNADHGAKLLAYDQQAKTALDGYLASIPAIGAAFTAVTADYTDGQGRLIQTTLTQGDRDTLAAAIEAELQ